MTGLFAGVVGVDPGPDERRLASAGAADVFLAACKRDGRVRWAFGFGGAVSGIDEFQFGGGVAADAHGVVGTGRAFGTADVEPSTGTTARSSAGQSDLFVVRYARDGALVRRR